LNYACKARIKTGLSIQTNCILSAFSRAVKGLGDFCGDCGHFVMHSKQIHEKYTPYFPFPAGKITR
ncbi:MAG: hypothetical protein ACI4O7_14665, partial [Aristaeellaceae bacterium]